MAKFASGLSIMRVWRPCQAHRGACPAIGTPVLSDPRPTMGTSVRSTCWEATMFGPVDDDEFFGYEDDDDEGWVPRPEWLHPDCRSVCLALELGTCCKYPDNPLVRVAVELADGVDRALRLAADEDGELPDAGLPDTESPDTESPETGLLYAELTR